MNSILRAAVRSYSVKALMPMSQRLGVRSAGFTRSLWQMSKGPETIQPVHKHSLGCACGCNPRYAHTDVGNELVDFLSEEIDQEKRIQSGIKIPTHIGDFQVKLDGAEVELTKQIADEKIIVKFNVNHTVDAEEPTLQEQNNPDDADIIKSKPTFEVDIVRGGTTLSFTCSFVSGRPEHDEEDDVFGIQEITIYSGEFSEKVYACSADVLDGYLYDLLLNLLGEKGISNKFANEVIELSTNYERSHYITLLSSLKKFVGGN